MTACIKNERLNSSKEVGELCLTAKQKAFVIEFQRDRNATKAAIRAGYASKTANREGSRLLSKAVIRRAIEVIDRNNETETRITRDYVVERLGNTFAEAIRTDDWRAACRTAELLAKMNGWIVERRDVRVIRSIRDLTSDELNAIMVEASHQLNEPPT